MPSSVSKICRIKVLAVGRAPGDYIVASALGETAQAGIPANLQADHLAVAVKVDLASGIAGLLREGQTVTLIGLLSPDVLQSVSVAPAPFNPALMPEPTAEAVITGPTPTPHLRPPLPRRWLLWRASPSAA